MSVIIKASQVTHTDIHMGAALYIKFMHIDTKNPVNYILTLRMYQTFLVLEKNIQHTITLRRFLNYPEIILRENEMNQILLLLLPFG